MPAGVVTAPCRDPSFFSNAARAYVTRDAALSYGACLGPGGAPATVPNPVSMMTPLGVVAGLTKAQLPTLHIIAGPAPGRRSLRSDSSSSRPATLATGSAVESPEPSAVEPASAHASGEEEEQKEEEQQEEQQQEQQKQDDVQQHQHAIVSPSVPDAAGVGGRRLQVMQRISECSCKSW